MALWNKIELLVLGLVIVLLWWRGHRRAGQSDSDEQDGDGDEEPPA
jgi:hypothetical protein